MSKFCEHCGSELNDTDKVCPNCGSAVEVKSEKKDVKSAKVVKDPVNTTEPKQKDNKKTIAIIGGAVAAAIIVIVIIIALMSGAYKSPLNSYFKGMSKSSTKTYLKAYPTFMKDDLEDKYDSDFMEKMMKNFEKSYGENIKITYKVLDKTKIDKKKLNDVQSNLKDKYDDQKKIKVTDGYEVCIKSTIKGKTDKDTSYSSLNVYKINGKWCLID